MKNKGREIIECSCGEKISLPYRREQPILDGGKIAWLPLLVAIRCSKCKKEIRLQDEK